MDSSSKCNNIANALRKLKRYDEARAEIERAIECYRPFGIAVETWKSFDILHDIEIADGNQQAARAAWAQARQAYLAYRQQGGYPSQGNGGKIVEHILGLLSQQKSTEVNALIHQPGNDPNASESLKKLMQAVLTILSGSRDPALADDPALDYDDAAEILFLIARLEP